MIDILKEQKFNICSLLQLSNPSPLTYLLVATAAAAIPLFLFSCTAYIKISVVLNIVKNSFGVQQIPANTITGILSLILTLYVMQPVFKANIDTVNKQLLHSANKKSFSLDSTELVCPWIKFLLSNSGKKEREYFLNVYSKSQKLTVQKDILIEQESIFTLLPAFMISQLREAFSFGLILYLPLLAVDIIVVNVLISLGLSMISPSIITLPLKLLLFVVSDAWLLLSKSLVMSFNS